MTIIRLDSNDCTYILSYDKNHLPCQTYWGARIFDSHSIESLEVLVHANEPSVFRGGLNQPYQLNIFPESSTGFKGTPALIGERAGHNWANNFSLVSMKEEGQMVVFTYEDRLANLQLLLELILDQRSNVLKRRTTLTNLGTTTYNLHHCVATAQPLPPLCNKVMKMHGCWTGEFMCRFIPFTEGGVQVENRTGRTSHEYFPALLAGEEGFSEDFGRVYGVHLGWSGNFRLLAEHLPDGTKQLQCGELLLPGEGLLAGGEKYISPWCFSTFSKSGMNGLSHNFHTHLRENVISPLISEKPRPVQLNTWEAIYFDHDMARLKKMAAKAEELGVERFVLDDGWFHGRSDDSRALGDWWPDAEKYPEGLSPLSEYVHGLGMQFGLWLEPEMVCEDSQLYREHPEWVLHLDGFARQCGRNQLVLNLARPEVVDYLFICINKLLSEIAIDYIKWDMNRILTEPADNGQPCVQRQTKALYDLIDRIREHHPKVEIETCASGGGRVDFEILQRTERFWASDSNDPLRRLQIQKGASIFFPPELIGSHVGPELCHTSGRITDIGFRASVSLCYHFGFELNPLELSESDGAMVRIFIDIYKRHRNLFHSGTYVRLDGVSSNRYCYGIINLEKTEGVFFIHQYDIDSQSANRNALFSGLKSDREYTLEVIYPFDPKMLRECNKIFANISGACRTLQFSGAYLMEWGLPLHLPFPGHSVIIRLN